MATWRSAPGPPPVPSGVSRRSSLSLAKQSRNANFTVAQSILRSHDETTKRRSSSIERPNVFLRSFTSFTSDDAEEKKEASVAKKLPSTLDLKLHNLGPVAHAAREYRVDNKGASSWLMTVVGDSRSLASCEGCSIEYAERKIAGVAAFIRRFPTLSSIKAGQAIEDVRRKRLYNAVCLQNEEDLETESTAAHLVEETRLVDSMTEGTIRELSNQMYNMLGVVEKDCEGVTVAEQTFAVGNVEAAVIAMDLTSEMQGVWRIPLTIVSFRSQRRYTHVCVLVLVGGCHCALLGSSVLQELAFMPLRRQRPSVLVRDAVRLITERCHDVTDLYLGVPMEAPADGSSIRQAIWRCLKLSLRRQEWRSILASVDLWAAERRSIAFLVTTARGGKRQEDGSGNSSDESPSAQLSPRRLPKTAARKKSSEKAWSGFRMPRGFSWLKTQRCAVRMKAVPPLLVRKRRQKRRVKPPSLGTQDPLGLVSDMCVWKHSEEEFLRFVHSPWKAADDSREFLDPEEWSSVSSASLEEHAEDYELDLLPKRDLGIGDEDIAGELWDPSSVLNVTQQELRYPKPTLEKSEEDNPRLFGSLHLKGTMRGDFATFALGITKAVSAERSCRERAEGKSNDVQADEVVAAHKHLLTEE